MRAIVLAMLVGCYAPSATTGAPCDERMVCPSGQSCVAGHCEREGTTADDAPLSDDAAIDSPPPSDGSGAGWSTPTPIGITVGDSKSDPSATPNRLTIAFVRADDVFFATRGSIGGAFTITPFPFNTTFSDKSPELTADGKTLYYASNPDGDYDIFMSTFTNNGWQTPAKVTVWSGTSNEQDVAISPDELTAFVTVSGDIRRSTRASKADPWPAPVSIGINWGTSPTAPSINSAGDVYFHANNPRDLFVARKNGNGYTSPVPVTELNTPAGREAAPYISADDRHLMFERDAELVESTR